MRDEHTEIEVAWLAGLLEGEGCFQLQSRSAPVIFLSMTDLDVVKRACRIVGLNSTRVIVWDRKFNYKTMYKIHICGKRAIVWLRLLRPYMGKRRGSKIDELLDAVNKYRSFAHLGDDFCAQKGHSIKHPWEYTLKDDGYKLCKRCRGCKVRAPIEKSDVKVISPFKRAV